MSERYEKCIKGLKSFLCKIGVHNWSENHNGIRICQWCPAVDRYFGLSGLLRKRDEDETGIKENAVELRTFWLKVDSETK
jgi:hypothetical protein